jgi:hypothetical protein
MGAPLWLSARWSTETEMGDLRVTGRRNVVARVLRSRAPRT